MYRLNRTEVSFDSGRVVYWLCEKCFDLVDEAVEVAAAAISAKPDEASIWR